MADDALDALRAEFEADAGSFLLQLRINLVWDTEAFSRLDVAMIRCCRMHADHDTLERWLAWGFWYVPGFVRDWTTHPDFPRRHSQEYYDRAYKRLDDLAYWFFSGQSPYIGDAGFDPI